MVVLPETGCVYRESELRSLTYDLPLYPTTVLPVIYRILLAFANPKQR